MQRLLRICITDIHNVSNNLSQIQHMSAQFTRLAHSTFTLPTRDRFPLCGAARQLIYFIEHVYQYNVIIVMDPDNCIQYKYCTLG